MTDQQRRSSSRSRGEREQVDSGGRPATSPDAPPTFASDAKNITSVKGIRIAACRKSVITTAHRPPTTQ
jgi:hypothetical protein